VVLRHKNFIFLKYNFRSFVKVRYERVWIQERGIGQWVKFTVTIYEIIIIIVIIILLNFINSEE